MRLCKFLICFIFLFPFIAAAEEQKPDLTLMAPMRDGVLLPTDIYLPHPEAKELPCIFLRGPAGRNAHSAKVFVSLAKLGYVIAIQDTRAATDVEGKTVPFLTDGWRKNHQDGFDSVEWLANHPLTNGRIGTLGYSNMGITQLLMAPTNPPGLKCQYIGVAASSLYHHAIFPNGKLLKNQVEGWLGYYAKDPTVLEFVTGQPHYNDFWQDFNTIKEAHKVTVPAIHQGGWYDTFIQGTLDGFVSRQESGGEGAKGTQKLLVGPWVHRYPETMALGAFEVPFTGRVTPYDYSPNHWFDYYLKGIPNKINEIPPVVYYVMGPFDGSPSSGNVWRTSDRWPVPHQETSFYLTNDHLLHEKPSQGDHIITYTYDPQHPVPTLGGRNLFLEAGPMDQRPIEKRKDVVIFTTEPLEEDLEVTGRIFAKLLFSSDEEDTDVAVRLTDVYPDGRSILIADGINRSQKSSKNEVEVDLWSTSIVFAKGHRIRIIVTGSNYPRYETHDLNSKPMAHKLHVGGENGSRLILPIVRKGDKWVAQKS